MYSTFRMVGNVSGGIWIRGERRHSRVLGSQIIGVIVCDRSFRKEDGSPLQMSAIGSLAVPWRIESCQSVQGHDSPFQVFDWFCMFDLYV